MNTTIQQFRDHAPCREHATSCGDPESSSHAAPHDPSQMRAHVVHALERLQQTLLEQAQLRGLPTGLDRLDEITHGLQPGRIYLIAGRPAMGKTGLLLQILAEVCLNQHIPSLLFTGDLTIPQVIDRLLFNHAMFPQCKLGDPQYALRKGDLKRIQESAGQLAESGLILDEIRNATFEALAAKARHERSVAGIGLIVIDHLHQLGMASTSPGTSRKREMAMVIGSLRELARELGVPILVSAHLKRRAEGRVPKCVDIRESGAIEHEADFIGLLHRETLNAEPHVIELLVAKNFNGALGPIRLCRIDEIQRFEEVPTEEQEISHAWQDYRLEKDFPPETA